MHIGIVKGNLKAEKTELCLNILVGYLLTKSTLKPAKLYVDFLLNKLLLVFIGKCRNAYLGIKLGEKLHCHRKCKVASFGVNCLFIARGCLGSVVVTKRGTANTC